MLARKYRLPSSVAFRNPHVFKENGFSVKLQKNTLPYGRYGFIVSKAVDKRATMRNRLKRLVRSFVEKQWVDNLKGCDVLFILRPEIKNFAREQIQEKLNSLLSKINQ